MEQHGKRRAAGKRRPAKFAPKEAFTIECKFVQYLAEDINTPRSIAVYMMIKYQCWADLLDLKDPIFDSYVNPTAAYDYQITEILKKNPRIPLGVSRKQVAFDKFLLAEELCQSTNVRWRKIFSEPSEHLQELAFILKVQQILSDALGPLTIERLERVESAARFGPGATSNCSGKEVLLSKKFACKTPHATPRLMRYVSTLWPENYPFSDANYEKEVDSKSPPPILDARIKPQALEFSNLIFVPKNAKVDRSICIEPHLNVYYQLGVAKLLRSALHKLGLEPDHQDRNRQFAKQAFRSGYATVDMSMASDTIASAVVFHLLPDSWFELLHLGRTDRVRVVNPTTNDVRILSLAKFSSMGNGYTWELESLIFYSIVRALTDAPIAVFGDDLVVPAHLEKDLSRAMSLFGFIVNDEKTHWQGVFFESCGHDYFEGKNIRPFYLKKDIRHVTKTEFAIHLANGIRQASHRLGGGCSCDRLYRRTWLYARSLCDVATYLSAGFGDNGLIVNYDELPLVLQHKRNRRGWEGTYGLVIYRRPLTSRHTDSTGSLLAALRMGATIRALSTETSRGLLGRPQLRPQLINKWADLGPWL